MRTRFLLLAFVVGVGCVHLLAQLLPQQWPAFSCGAFAVAAGHVSRRRSVSEHRPALQWLGIGLWAVSAFSAGFLYGTLWADHRLADKLEPTNEDKVTRVVLRVAELPRLDPQSRSFVAEVLSSVPSGVPARIQVRWNAGRYPGPYGPRPGSRPEDFPELIPGQVWRMALILRTPHGQRNHHGFDYEGYVFARGIRAVGTVRGKPVLLDDQPWAGLSVAAQRARHHVREAMLQHIGDLRWGPVLLALAIGDQASVAAADWQTFNRSGLTHLVSISGSHVTMIAVIAGMIVNFLWRRMSWRGGALAERLPAQLAAAWSALVVAWLYCLLAGWGVPARRTFVMLAVMALSLALRVPLAPSHILAAAAAAVVCLDPWSLLSSGFWLSFLAVYVLMATTGWWGQTLARKAGAMHGMLGKLRTAAILQLFVTLALLPALALLFSEVSLVSPLANAYAIPVIGVLVTPLALLLAGLALIPGLEGIASAVAFVAHGLLEICMWATSWLAELPGASLAVAVVPWWATAFAMLGILLALQPRGLPLRALGWTFMLPVLLHVPVRPEPGDWELYALDVGQGSALVLLTHRHVMVYDTGQRYSADSDATARAVLPFLRAKGVRDIDVLVVSHADLDHVGGLRSMLDGMAVEQAYASFDLPAWLAREGRLLGGRDMPPLPRASNQCRYGVGWRVDGVRFDFLWPLGARSIDLRAGTRERNRNACVLRISGATHSILLPGDIGADEEEALVDRGLGKVDVVVAAHHGSRHSSGPPFVAAVDAQHVIAQAGRWNRYGHPTPVVRDRWEVQGAVFRDTAAHGAILARSRNGVLEVVGERERHPQYWSTSSCTECSDAR